MNAFETIDAILRGHISTRSGATNDNGKMIVRSDALVTEDDYQLRYIAVYGPEEGMSSSTRLVFRSTTSIPMKSGWQVSSLAFVTTTLPWMKSSYGTISKQAVTVDTRALVMRSSKC